MQPQFSEEEWKALCGVVTDRMKEFTAPFVTPLVHQSSGEPARVGSGTFFTQETATGGGATLISCEHVLRFLPIQQIPRGSDKLLYLTGTLFSETHPIDAATIKIEPEEWESTRHSAEVIPFSKFAAKHAPMEREILFFYGIAGENAHIAFGGMDKIMTGYCSQEKLNTGDTQIFEMFWESQETEISQGTDAEIAKRVRMDSPEGFSGSLVWNTKFVESGCDLGKWHPNQSQVTGLLRRWDTTTKTLLVWRIEHVVNWLRARPSWA